MSGRLSRRSFLLKGASGTAAVAAGTALGVSEGASGASAADTSQAALNAAEPKRGLESLDGIWQQGVLNEPLPNCALVSLDVTATTKGQLEELFRTLTSELSALYRGGPATEAFNAGVAPDDGILGPDIPSGQLLSTVSIGASLFDHRFGLARLKPARLQEMSSFPNDNLQSGLCGGDVSLVFQAAERDTVVHAVRRVLQATDGAWQPRWRMDGFSNPPRPSGRPRNLFGFNDGIANPTATSAKQMNALLWAATDGSEPSWTRNGTYQVIRIIRQLVEFWDRVSVQEQELMIGRRRDNGAVLGANDPETPPDYKDDPAGRVIPLTAHIRLANPRTAGTEPTRILRRSFNYDLGIDSNGNLNQGLLFLCYQQDLKRQFIEVQTRLINEPMIDYISPVGGGYFFTLPGIRRGGYLGQGLLSSTM